MNRVVAWLVLATVAIGMGYLLWTDPKTQFVWLSVLVALPLLLASGYFAFGIADRIKASRADHDFANLLGDRTLDEVLEQSAYTYAWAGQGSDAYLIVRKEGDDEPVAVVSGEGAARMWIVAERVKGEG